MSRFREDRSPRAARRQDSRKISTGPANQKPRAKSQEQPVAVPPPEPRPGHLPGARSLLAAAALALITLLAFSNSFSAGFVLDNKGLLLQDPRIRELSAANIRLILQHTYWWPNGEAGLYRPFTTLSYLFNYAVLGNGEVPAGYHAINFLLHLGNVFLVYALVRRLLRNFWPAFFAAALWAVHPVLTESVTNMIGRADLLSALAVLSGFLMYLKSTESAGWRSPAWLAGLLAVTAVGVFSKESAVVIVGVIVLYELTWWKERKASRPLLLGCLATLLPIVAMLYQRSIVLAASPPAEFPFTDNPIVGASFWTGRLTALEVIPRYLLLMLWPATLSSDYSYAQIPLARGTFQDWLACLAVLAAALLVAALYRWNRTAFFLASFAAVTFAPMSNLLFPIGTIMAERFLYLPAIGLLACLVVAIYAVGRRVPVKHLAPVVLCAITAAFAVRTWVRNRDWRDERTMAEASVRTSPQSFKVHRLLATTLYESDSSGTSLDRAIQEAEKAMAIVDPLPDTRNEAKVYRMAGKFYILKGDSLRDENAVQSSQAYQRAVQILTRAIAIDRKSRVEYDRRGGAEWARRHSALAVSAQGDPDARWMLAAAYWRLGEAPEATAAAREALTYHPRDPEAYRQMASIFTGQNRIEDAATALMEGGLITSDRGFRSDLLKLYAGAPDHSCALTNGQNGPRLNIACPAVHQPFCAAYLEMIRAAVEDEHRDEARQEKQDYLKKYGCPAGPLVQVLPD